MSAVADAAPPPPPAPAPAPPPTARFGGLLRAEVHRFLARRFIQVLLGLAVLGWLGAVVVALTQFSSPTPERLAGARAAMTEEVRLAEQLRQECLDDPNRPTGVPADEWCGPEFAPDLQVADYLRPPAFSLAMDGVGGAVAAGVLAALLAFLLGATFVGAEWSSRSIVALLFWETRRTRVMGAKLLVMAAAGAVLGVLAQLAWLATAGLLQSVVGDGVEPPPGFWPELLGTAGRGVLLTVLAGLLGLGLTNLVRNTGAALGIGFAYFAVVQTAVSVLRPGWQPWLLSNNAAGLVLPGGVDLATGDGTGDGQGRAAAEAAVYELGNLQAGVFLCVVTAVLVGAGVALFARRDVH